MLQKIFAIFVILATISLVQGVDQTLEERTFGADVADAVVRRITRTGIFPDDQNLFRRIAFTETRFGEDPKTYRPDYFGGIWQVDEEYFNLTKGLTDPENIYTEIQTRWGIDWNGVIWSDLLKPFYSGLASRLFIQYLVNDPQNLTIPGTVADQANYWVENYRQDSTAENFIRQVRALESDVVCEGMMDICIVLDGSNSIGAGDFEKAKGFVADLVKSFSVDNTRVAFITYGDEAYEIFDFQHSLNNEEMDAVIRNASYPNANTNTPAGLLMGVEFYEAIGSRNGVPQVITTFTDGLYNRGNLPAALDAVKNAGLISFSIGIGSDIEYFELLMISLLDPKRVFMINDYDALAEFFYHMNAATCEVPQQPALGTEQSGQLNPDERRYFRYPFPQEDGVGIKIDIQSTGEAGLSGWYSYTEATPNSAVNDGEIGPGSVTIPPPLKPRLRQEDGEEEPALYITLVCAPGDTRGEYVILAEEDSQVTGSPATTEEVQTTTEEVETTTEEVQTTTEEVETTTEEVQTTTEEVETTTEEVQTTTEEVETTTEEVQTTTEEVQTTTEDVTPTTEKATEEVPTTTEDVVTTTEDVVTTTEDVATTTEDVATTTEDVATTTEDVVTTTEDIATTTEDVVKTTEEAPTTTEDAPTTTEDAPTTTEDAPTTTEDAPTTTEDAPTTTEKDPATTEKDPTTTEVPSTTAGGSTLNISLPMSIITIVLLAFH